MELTKIREKMCAFLGCFQLRKWNFFYSENHNSKKDVASYKLPMGSVRIWVESQESNSFFIKLELVPESDLEKEIAKRFEKKYTDHGVLIKVDDKTKKFDYEEWMSKIQDLVNSYNRLIGKSFDKQQEIKKVINGYINTLKI